MADTDLYSELSEDAKKELDFRMRTFSPDDGKYYEVTKKLADYLTPEAEWHACALVQYALIDTRLDFGMAKKENVAEVRNALSKINTSNITLLEDKVTKHDQLAVIEEIGRYVSQETKAMLHPGTTSYDVLDTARAFNLKSAWIEVIKPEIKKTVTNLIILSNKAERLVQAGRTHLQDTSPVPFATTFALYAARIAERLEFTDRAVDSLRGKISGIVGTGASIDMVIGEGKSIEFEKAALAKLGLEPDYTSTQITQKERLADVGHGTITMMQVLADFANDVRLLYSTAINELTTASNRERLGGSSADATKNNPVNYENIAGKAEVVRAGMSVLYSLLQSDLQRDLRGSVAARYQPTSMIVQTYESFVRANKTLKELTIIKDKVNENLERVRAKPSEAMVAILRGEPEFMHPEYGVGHSFVKEMGKLAQKQKRPLLEVCLEDPYFARTFNDLPDSKREILRGNIEGYIGSAFERAEINIKYANEVISSL